MNVTLTPADERDLKEGSSINAAADDGAEVNLYPATFTPLVWAALETGHPASFEIDGIEVVVRLEVPSDPSADFHLGIS